MAGRCPGRPTYARVPGRRDVNLKPEESLRKLVKLRSIRRLVDKTIPEVDQTRQAGGCRILICRRAVKGKEKERLPHDPDSHIVKLGGHSLCNQVLYHHI